MQPPDESMSRAMQHLVHRTLARGWVSWHSWWSVVAHKRGRMVRALRHLVNRTLSRGWVSWVQLAEERAERLRLLRKGVGFLAHRHLGMG